MLCTVNGYVMGPSDMWISFISSVIKFTNIIRFNLETSGVEYKTLILFENETFRNENNIFISNTSYEGLERLMFL